MWVEYPVKIVKAFANTVISGRLKMRIPSDANRAYPALLVVNNALPELETQKTNLSPLLWS